MSWRYAVRLLNGEGQMVSEQSALDREGMFNHVDVLTQHIGPEFDIEIETYDPDEVSN